MLRLLNLKHHLGICKKIQQTVGQFQTIQFLGHCPKNYSPNIFCARLLFFNLLILENFKNQYNTPPERDSLVGYTFATNITLLRSEIGTMYVLKGSRRA